MPSDPDRFPHLFRPGRIGSLSLRNRLVMSPMENLYATPEGLPSAQTRAYYAARARGGVGLITTGASCIDARHKELPLGLHFASDDVIDSHRALTDLVHEHGARIQPQIAHAGPDGVAPQVHQIESLGPSAIQSYLTGTTSRALTTEEFGIILDQYRAAARRVREAGYDGLELHAAHGYMLLGSFLTPWRNARQDEYTGRSREGRIRALIETIRAIKSEVGADFPLTLRISGFERIAGGRASPDTAMIAPELAAAGVDAFHITGGVIDRLVSKMVNGSHDPDGLNVAQARAVKNAVETPVMVVGRIHTPERAEAILAAGAADFIVLGRPLLADPDWPEKARTGRRDRIRPCISCQNCIDAMETRFAMDCAVNPTTGREEEIDLSQAAESRRVVVVGGGPGGLEAARVAALRGHRVTLYEKSSLLGGALIAAATVHPENGPFLDWLLREVARLGVDVRLESEVDAAAIERVAPDAVIVATGGRLTRPEIPGDDLPHVYSGRLLREWIAGRGSPEADRLPGWLRHAAKGIGPFRKIMRPGLLRRVSRIALPFGRRVAIVGSDLAALELAEFLAERGRTVSIFDTAASVAPEVGGKRRMEHMDRLDRAGVSINLETRVVEIERGRIRIARDAGDATGTPRDPAKEKEIPIETVLLAGHVEPDLDLHATLEGRVPQLHAVGDCTGLGLIQKAVLEGAQAGAAIE